MSKRKLSDIDPPVAVKSEIKKKSKEKKEKKERKHSAPQTKREIPSPFVNIVIQEKINMPPVFMTTPKQGTYRSLNAMLLK